MPMFLRKLTLALAAFALALPAPTLAQSRHLLEYPSIHSPVVGTRGMVVSQNEMASSVGAQILRDGGNAVDAAVAVAFALAVTLPRAGNVGGDGFITVYDAKSKQVRVIDFRGIAPRAATAAMFVDNKGKERGIASYGYLAPSVPGSVAGLEHAHRKWGKLPWAKVVEPALRLARDGVKLTADEAFVFGWGRDRLSKSVSGKQPSTNPMAASMPRTNSSNSPTSPGRSARFKRAAPRPFTPAKSPAASSRT
jgi:gamma-glutamyltranspeptidase/glutathione hydrolase